ncbi:MULTISPECIES: YgjV family protein [Photobacterium]|uniref:YgjV family protein n=1 Tax=Photobacterium TaxID=657 RepID=UPI00056BA982|nr:MULTISPECIES: YgjV family protein [Photobacterium]
MFDTQSLGFDVEIIGYIGSLLVGISLLMTNMERLRYFNFCGCMMFVVYGVFIDALPVALLNAFCAMINIYHVLRLKRVA